MTDPDPFHLTPAGRARAERREAALDRLQTEIRSQQELVARARGSVSRADLAELARAGRHDLIDQARTEGRITYTTREN